LYFLFVFVFFFVEGGGVIISRLSLYMNQKLQFTLNVRSRHGRDCMVVGVFHC